MEATEIKVFDKPTLSDPMFIEGLTGIGHVGRTAAAYLIDHIQAKKLAELYSCHFPHWAILDEDKVVDILKNELYYWKAKKKNQRDLIILTGNAQSLDPIGHYTVIHKILKFLKDNFGVKEVITLGGYGTGELVSKPRVFGAVSDKKLKSKYKKQGVNFNHDIGQIVGASGLILGIGKYYNMEGVCLLGETPGFLLSDPKATESVLKVLDSILHLDLDYTNLDKKVKESEVVLKRLQKLQREIEEQHPVKTRKDLGYIG